MTTKYIDTTVEATRDAHSVTTAGTVTGDVRVVYDDTVKPGDLVNCLQRVIDSIRESLT